MIGYYVHHHGRGHLHRALSIASHLDTAVVGLSSLARPSAWRGPWIQLPRDDDGAAFQDVDAHGRLHWVPEHHAGLRDRMGEIASWIAHVEPELIVVDVSVEVALLARLHGVPVVTVGQPGDRRDAAHSLGFAVSRAVLAPWPAHAHGMLRGPGGDPERLVAVGAVSRFDDRPAEPRPERAPGERRRVLLMLGAGGSDVPAEHLEAARAQTPDWTWDVLGGDGPWVDDTWAALCAADVVVTHAGQNAVAEVAAAQRPAVIVPQDRPHGEQDALAAALALSPDLPTLVQSAFPAHGWHDLLDEAAALDGRDWTAWNDRHGAERAARVLRDQLRAGPDGVLGDLGVA